MNNGGTTGAKLHRSDITSGDPRNWNDEGAKHVWPSGGQHVGFGQLQDEVGPSELPRIDPTRHFRQLVALPLHCTTCNPTLYQVDLLIGQPSDACELAVRLLRFPGRHVAA